MSIELKQAAQQALDAFDAFGDDDDFASLFALAQKMKALHTAIQQAEAQQPATTEPVGYLYDFKYDDEIVRDWFTQNIDEIQFRPDTCLNIRPLYTHHAPGVPEFSRIAKRKLDELQEQGFAITGYAIQRGPVRGFIDGGGFVGWWQGEPDPGVPDGWRIEEKGGELIVQKNGFGGYSARKNTESIAEAVLHELALDLLAASPAQKGGE